MINSPPDNPWRVSSDCVAGLLLGGAVGDALGLPVEGLSARRARRMFRTRTGERMSYHFLPGSRGMFSDDTEHACMTAQALLASAGAPPAFSRSLAWRLRFWLAALPAGVGWATLRACIKLWLGFGPAKSGVNSAGNGPCMRSPVLGVVARDVDHLCQLVKVSTRMTHTHPAAEQGALAIALAARLGAELGPAGVTIHRFRGAINGLVTEPAILRGLDLAEPHLARGDGAAAFAATMGLSGGVSGYVNHTVPVAIYCWLRWPNDFAEGLVQAIELGGDADTVGAITGSFIGATVGVSGIPRAWLDGIVDWPRSVKWIGRVAEALTRMVNEPETAGSRPVPLKFWGLLPRNVLFLVVVLMHGLRRMFPPY